MAHFPPSIAPNKLPVSVTSKYDIFYGVPKKGQCAKNQITKQTQN